MSSLILLIVLPLALALFVDGIPSIAKRSVELAAGRTMPWERDAHRSDWLANLATFDSRFGKLSWAAQCWLASFRLAAPFYQLTADIGLWLSERRLAFFSVGVMSVLERKLEILPKSVEAIFFYLNYILARKALLSYINACSKSSSVRYQPQSTS